MNEPIPQTGEQAGESRLWDKAPAWRNLTIAATLLTAVAAALPLALPPQTGAPVHVAVAPHGPAPSPAMPPVVQTPAPVHLALAPPAPLAEPSPPQTAPVQACPLPINTTPRHLGTAVVVGFVSQQQSTKVFLQKTANLGAPVNPAYLDYVRLLIHPDKAPDGVTRGTLAPASLHVAAGDRVSFDSAYRDPSGACLWIPTLVSADLGPANTPLAAQPEAQP